MDDKGLKGNGGALKAEIFFFVDDGCIRVKVVIMKIDDGEIMGGKEKKIKRQGSWARPRTGR